MKKTYKRVPFDIKLAKKIQSREVEGHIKTKCGNEVRVLCFDLIDPRDVSFPIVCALYSDKNVRINRFTKCGRYIEDINTKLDLVLEVPDNEPQKPQVKPFDKVLVRNKGGASRWYPRHYAETDGLLYYTTDAKSWKECIPYEGNEHLVSTTDKPTKYD